MDVTACQAKPTVFLSEVQLIIQLGMHRCQDGESFTRTRRKIAKFVVNISVFFINFLRNIIERPQVATPTINLIMFYSEECMITSSWVSDKVALLQSISKFETYRNMKVN